MSIAILGGTFDPIHLGHLLIAEQAYNKFKLDEVIFMPAGSPPHKNDINISAPNHRLEMVKRAVKDNPHFFYSDWELKKTRVSYTVDTLLYFKEKGYEDVYFIIGSDSLLDLPNWKKPQYLMGHANFIVAHRPNYPINSTLERDFYRPYQENIHIIDNVRIDISATEIRKMVEKGQSVKYLVPASVIDYVREQNLYST